MNDRDVVTQTEELITASLPGVTKVEIKKVKIFESIEEGGFPQWLIYVEMQPADCPLLNITEFTSLLDTESQTKIIERLKAAWEKYIA